MGGLTYYSPNPPKLQELCPARIKGETLPSGILSPRVRLLPVSISDGLSSPFPNCECLRAPKRILHRIGSCFDRIRLQV